MTGRTSHARQLKSRWLLRLRMPQPIQVDGDFELFALRTPEELREHILATTNHVNSVRRHLEDIRELLREKEALGARDDRRPKPAPNLDPPSENP